MPPDKSDQMRRPLVVTASFWCQLALAGLLLVVGVIKAFWDLVFVELYGDVASGSLNVLPGLLLALGCGLAATAFGLRRGNRIAYRLSLAGLVLMMLIVLAASVFDVGTPHTTSIYITSGEGSDMSSLTNEMAVWTMVSYLIDGLVPVLALGLVVTIIGMLMTPPSRRFFVGSVRPGESAAP